MTATPEARERQAQRRNRPEAKAKQVEYTKQYRTLPHAKAAKKINDTASLARPGNRDRKNAAGKLYRDSPEGQAAQIEYRSRPEIVERKREFGIRYRARPGMREKLAGAKAAWAMENFDELSARRARFYKENPRSPESSRASHLSRKYGMTVAEWDDMFEKQGKRCAACLAAEPGGKWWNTDHDHATGYVRGILCNGCNTGLGHLRDSIPVLKSMIDYLVRHLTSEGPFYRAEPAQPDRRRRKAA